MPCTRTIEPEVVKAILNAAADGASSLSDVLICNIRAAIQSSQHNLKWMTYNDWAKAQCEDPIFGEVIIYMRPEVST